MVQSFWIAKGFKRRQSVMKCTTRILSAVGSAGATRTGTVFCADFLPKGTDFSALKPRELKRIEDWVNNYPRKIFGYKTANDMYAAAA